MQTKILSCAAYLPDQCLTNDDLTKIVDTSDEWIYERTGIKRRYRAAKDEYTSDLGFKAAEQALKNANLTAQEIDLIIVATTTPDNIFPATAVKIQQKLNIENICAFDVQAVCSGFIYALTIADKFLKTGSAKKALVIGAETMSRIMDWNDRTTCILFGDGAGAVVLSTETSGASDIIDSSLHSDGKYTQILYTNGGPSLTGGKGKIIMQGREVFKQAVNKMSASVLDIMAKIILMLQISKW